MIHVVHSSHVVTYMLRVIHLDSAFLIPFVIVHHSAAMAPIRHIGLTTHIVVFAINFHPHMVTAAQIVAWFFRFHHLHIIMPLHIMIIRRGFRNFSLFLIPHIHPFHFPT
jgi:hypothetical protein